MPDVAIKSFQRLSIMKKFDHFDEKCFFNQKTLFPHCFDRHLQTG